MARQALNQFLNRTIFFTCKLKVVTIKGDTNSGSVDWAISSMQGRRESMEDAHCVVTDAKPGTHVFAMFDGHRGAETAIFAAQALPTLLEKTELRGDSTSIQRTLQGAFHGVDKLLANACHASADRTSLMENSYLTDLISSRLRGSVRVEQLEQAAKVEGWCYFRTHERPRRESVFHHALRFTFAFISRCTGTPGWQGALRSSRSSTTHTVGSPWLMLATLVPCFAVWARPSRSAWTTSRA